MMGIKQDNVCKNLLKVVKIYTNLMYYYDSY
jgi:hypothetical protein